LEPLVSVQDLNCITHHESRRPRRLRGRRRNRLLHKEETIQLGGQLGNLRGKVKKLLITIGSVGHPKQKKKNLIFYSMKSNPQRSRLRLTKLWTGYINSLLMDCEDV